MEDRKLITAPAKYRYTAWPNIIDKAEHWFSKPTMSFFGSRISWGTLREMAGDNFTFISSEVDPSGVRRYSVREVYGDGTINTLGEFAEHATRAEAVKAQARFHKEEEDLVASFPEN